MQVPVHNTQGEQVGEVELSDAVFGAPLNAELIHQAMLYYQANQRLGTSNTLTRAHVSGGGRKPYPQKHTGRARQGSTRSPQFRHGGVVFGPHPRTYRQRLPKRMRRGALRSVLSGKIAEQCFVLVDQLPMDQPKTKTMREALTALGVDSSALVVLRSAQPAVALAIRNLPRVKTLAADLLNVLDLLRYHRVVMTVDAARRAEELWADTAVHRGTARTALLDPPNNPQG